MGWLMLILFIVLVFIVWISLVNNTKKYKHDFHLEDHSPTRRAENIEILLGSTEFDLKAQSKNKTEQKPVGPDDLTIIEGIGPKVSSVLNQAGIFNFKQLSETGISRLKDILEKAKYPYMDPSTWAKQSQLAAEGKNEELKLFQAQLKAGRK
jgi:predicted flap endonuclease-1-like 5' DNA nuclease